MKKFSSRILTTLLLLMFLPSNFLQAADLSTKLKGRILLQVESRGEAWYINPKDGLRYYMADGNSAYTIMRNKGVGITNADLTRAKLDINFAKKHVGKIFLQVQSLGEAYYVNVDGKLHYLKDGSTAYTIMRELGLGITNDNLEKISVSPNQDNKTIVATQNITQSITESILCNGKYWTKCDAGKRFVCPSSGNAYCENESSTLVNNSLVCNGKTWTACATGSKFVCPSSGDAYCQKEYTSSELNEGSNNKTTALESINKALNIYNDVIQKETEVLQTIERNLDALVAYGGKATETYIKYLQAARSLWIAKQNVNKSMVEWHEQVKTKTMAIAIEGFVSYDLTNFLKMPGDAEKVRSEYLTDKASFDDTARTYQSILIMAGIY